MSRSRTAQGLVSGALLLLSAAAVAGLPDAARAGESVDRACPLGPLDALAGAKAVDVAGVSGEKIAALRDEYARLETRADRLEERRREQDAQGCGRSRVGSAQDSRCLALKTEIEAEWSAYDGQLDAYEKARRAARDEAVARSEPALAAVESRLQATALQLQALSVDGERWTKDAEEWAELGRSAHVTLFVDAITHVARDGLDELGRTSLAAARVSEETRRTLDAWWRARETAFPAAYRRAIDARIRSLRTHADLAALTRQLVDDGSRAFAMSEGGAVSAAGHAVVGILTIYLAAIESPLLLVVEVVDRGFAAGYGLLAKIAAEQRIDELTALRERQLVIADRLGQMYVRDVGLRRTLSELGDALRADPCP